MTKLRLQNANDVGYDVVLCAGQSNEVGANTDVSPAYYDAPDPRVWQYPGSGSYLASAVAAIEPLIHHDGAHGVGHAFAWGRQYVQTVPPNRRVLLVCAAHTATGFTTSSLSSPPAGYTGGFGGSWDPANGSGGVDLAQFAIDQANAAVALSPTNRLVAVLWLQGEADASALTQAQYAAKLDALIVKFRAGITGAASVPFVLGQMVPEGITGAGAFAGRNNINAAHIDTPNRVVRTGFAYGPTGYGTGTTSPANTHYTAAGQRILAPDMFKAFQRARANVLGTAPVAPSAVTAAQSGTSVIVTFTRPLCRMTDYLVETNRNGAGWVTFAHTATIDKTFTVTGFTVGDVVQVRVSTVNEQGTSAPSPPVSVTLLAVPGQVTGAAAGTATSSAMPLSWSALTGATSYLVEYKKHADSTWLTSGTVTGLAATVTGLANTTSYDFRVSGQNAAGTGTASATVTATTAVAALLLEDVGAAADQAYGTRRLTTAYAGSLIRVRRSSDNTQQDIGYITNGDLDTAALLTFVGAGSGFVVTWYDQSGNGRNFTQATTTTQARIVNAGTLDTLGGKPTAVFDGADDIYIDSTAGNVGLYAAGACTQGAVANTTTPTGSARLLLTEGGSGTTQIYSLLGIGTSTQLATTIRSDDSSLLINSTNGVIGGAAHTRWSSDDSFVVQRWIDGAKLGSFEYTFARSSKAMTLTRRALGGNFTTQYMATQLCEVVAWKSVLSDAQVAVGSLNQKTYYGTP